MNVNKVNYCIDRDISGVELMDAYFVSNKSNPHSHNEYVIGVVESGVQNYNLKSSTAKVISKGQIPIVNPGSLHNCINVDNKGYKCRVFYVEPKVFEKIAIDIHQDITESPLFFESTVKDAFLEKMLLRLHYSLFSNGLDIIQKQNYLYEAFAYLIKNHSTVKPKVKTEINSITINRVREYIHANFNSKINLTDLESVAGISAYHLNRMFSKLQGVPPHQYLINLRLNKARELLKQNYSVTDVTYKTGFFDQSHFSRNFKLFLGITPKQYQLAIM